MSIKALELPFSYPEMTMADLREIKAIVNKHGISERVSKVMHGDYPLKPYKERTKEYIINVFLEKD